MDRSIFITRFKELYKEKGWTQQDVAEALGYGVERIKSYVKKDGVMPPIEVLGKMGELFDVDIAYLIGEQDCRHHADQTICDVTHLSEQAASVLCGLSELYAKNLNKIITDTNFHELLKYFSIFLMYDDMPDTEDYYNIEDYFRDKNMGFNFASVGERRMIKSIAASLFDEIITDSYKTRTLNEQMVCNLHSVFQLFCQILEIIKNYTQNISTHDKYLTDIELLLDIIQTLQWDECKIPDFKPEYILTHEKEFRTFVNNFWNDHKEYLSIMEMPSAACPVVPLDTSALKKDSVLSFTI